MEGSLGGDLRTSDLPVTYSPGLVSGENLLRRGGQHVQDGRAGAQGSTRSPRGGPPAGTRRTRRQKGGCRKGRIAGPDGAAGRQVARDVIVKGSRMFTQSWRKHLWAHTPSWSLTPSTHLTFALALNVSTVDSIITHTPREGPKCMGFHGVWVGKGSARLALLLGHGQAPVVRAGDAVLGALHSADIMLTCP